MLRAERSKKAKLNWKRYHNAHRFITAVPKSPCPSSQLLSTGDVRLRESHSSNIHLQDTGSYSSNSSMEAFSVVAESIPLISRQDSMQQSRLVRELKNQVESHDKNHMGPSKFSLKEYHDVTRMHGFDRSWKKNEMVHSATFVEKAQVTEAVVDSSVRARTSVFTKTTSFSDSSLHIRAQIHETCRESVPFKKSCSFEVIARSNSTPKELRHTELAFNDDQHTSKENPDPLFAVKEISLTGLPNVDALVQVSSDGRVRSSSLSNEPQKDNTRFILPDSDFKVSEEYNLTGYSKLLTKEQYQVEPGIDSESSLIKELVDVKIDAGVEPYSNQPTGLDPNQKDQLLVPVTQKSHRALIKKIDDERKLDVSSKDSLNLLKPETLQEISDENSNIHDASVKLMPGNLYRKSCHVSEDNLTDLNVAKGSTESPVVYGLIPKITYKPIKHLMHRGPSIVSRSASKTEEAISSASDVFFMRSSMDGYDSDDNIILSNDGTRFDLTVSENQNRKNDFPNLEGRIVPSSNVSNVTDADEIVSTDKYSENHVDNLSTILEHLEDDRLSTEKERNNSVKRTLPDYAKVCFLR